MLAAPYPFKETVIDRDRVLKLRGDTAVFQVYIKAPRRICRFLKKIFLIFDLGASLNDNPGVVLVGPVSYRFQFGFDR